MPSDLHLPGQRRSTAAAEAALVGSLLLLVFAAYASFVYYGLDLLDEGYFAYLASRVAAGDRPYRDFAIPYTPGLFYVHALLMQLAEQDLVAIRLAQIAARVAGLGMVYALGRQLMPPAFAALPALFLFAVDTAPGHWEVHPAWYALVWTLASVWCVARYAQHGRGRWLFGAGVGAAAAFAFKQNLAAFAVLAALWFLVVDHPSLPALWRAPRPRRLAQPSRAAALAGGALRLFAVPILPLAAAVLLRRYLLPEVVALFLLPLVVLALLALRREGADLEQAGEPGRRQDQTTWLDVLQLLGRPALFCAGFAAATLPWLLALVAALDGRLGLLSPFVGGVDPAGYFLRMPPPPWNREHLWLVALALPTLVWALARAGAWNRKLLAAALAALAAVLAVDAWAAGGQVYDILPRAAEAWSWAHSTALGVLIPYDQHAHLLMYLPATILIVAIVASLPQTQRPDDREEEQTARGRRQTTVVAGEPPELPTANCQLPTDARPAAASRQPLIRTWYLVAGATLMLNQYPRFDEVHILWSGPVLFVLGADLLYRLYRTLVGSAPALAASASARTALWASLLALPVAAAGPLVRAKLETLPSHASAVASQYPAAALVPLTAAGAQFWGPAWLVNPARDVVEHLAANSEPGEPIFVYPAAPGLYYLSGRTNVSRHNHIFPGMLTPDEEQDLVARLDRVRYVVWDNDGAGFWVSARDYPLLNDYLRHNFRVDAVIGPYMVLARDAAGPLLADARPRG